MLLGFVILLSLPVSAFASVYPTSGYSGESYTLTSEDPVNYHVVVYTPLDEWAHFYTADAPYTNEAGFILNESPGVGEYKFVWVPVGEECQRDGSNISWWDCQALGGMPIDTYDYLGDAPEE